MEKNQPRVLAYNLAHPIPDHQLEDISGGGTSNNLHITFKITAPYQSYDMEPDYRAD